MEALFLKSMTISDACCKNGSPSIFIGKTSSVTIRMRLAWAIE
jgi:hypothetical protein